MSVATEFPPAVYIPERARTARPPERVATVTELFAPAERSVAAPLRLTRRGVVALGLLVAAVAVALVGVAWLSAPPAASTPAGRAVPDTVTVRAGDTLWSIATRVAPQRDPRAEIAELSELNHLAGVTLVPGQVLRTH